ncbi:hypothetical protein EMIT0P260_180045 [Pseudomonas sp. IT-P260]
MGALSHTSIDWTGLFASKLAPTMERISNVGASLLAKGPARAIYPYRLTFRKQNQKQYLLYLYTKA